MKKNLFRYIGYGFVVALLVHRERGNGKQVARDELKCAEKGQLPEPAPAPERPKGVLDYFKRTFQEFLNDDCMTQAASIAYATVFSLPPLLLLVIAIAGMVFGRAAVQHQIQEQIQGLIGSGAAGQVEIMVKSAGQNHSGSILGAALGILFLVFGATGALTALQNALNNTWHVKPNPRVGGIKAFLGKRILSFGMILVIGFLLLVSLALSASLAAFGGWVAQFMPKFVSTTLLHIAGDGISLAVVAVLFAAMFKFLPDAQIAWREVWVGALITAILFTAGKTLIGLYLGRSGAASAYGAAGSLMLIVLWLYYASIIVLFGAEFTKVWAWAHGREIRPDPGAVRVVTEERHEP